MRVNMIIFLVNLSFLLASIALAIPKRTRSISMVVGFCWLIAQACIGYFVVHDPVITSGPLIAVAVLSVLVLADKKKRTK